MMHWIQKYKSGRRIPAYFEYDYGIEFMKEREFLKEHKYLDGDYKVTALGKDAMQQHFDVIEKRHPKPSYTSKTPVGFANTGQSARLIPVDIVPGTIDIPDSDLNLIKKELEVGNILDQDDTSNRKQELTARKWAYEKVLPREAIETAFETGHTELWDIAEYLDIDEAFLREALKYYGILDI